MQLLFSLLLSVIVGMDTLFPMQEVCRLLDIDTSTLYRWCKRAGIALQSDSQDKRRRMLPVEQVQRLAELHGISLAPEEKTHKQDIPFDEILTRLEAIEQHLQTLHHEIMNLSQALHMQHELLRASQPVIAAQPPQTPPIPRHPPSASSDTLKEGLKRGRPPVLPGTRQPVPAHLPEGTVHIIDFAAQLGVNKRSLLGYILDHDLEHIAIPKRNRPGEHDRFLTLQQQQEVRRRLQR